MRLGRDMRRAIEKYDVNVIGLTLSKNQAAHVQKSFDEMDSPRPGGCCCRAGSSSTSPSTASCRSVRSNTSATTVTPTSSRGRQQILPADGVMMLHTITGFTRQQMIDTACRFLRVLRFVHFIMTEIFPGGAPPTIEMVEEHSRGGLHADPPPVAAAALRQHA